VTATVFTWKGHREVPFSFVTMAEAVFRFKQFSVRHDHCAVKVGTDAVLLGAWTDFPGAERILDIGTGCGVLALIAAQKNTTAMIDAVEIDDAAAEQASENFAESPWSARLRAHRMDVRRMKGGGSYDLIICNPPYYEGEAPSPNDRRSLAKHSGELSFVELPEVAGASLAAEGRLNVVLPLNRETQFVQLAVDHGLSPSRRCVVRYLASRPPKRVMLEMRRASVDRRDEEIVVEVAPGKPDAGYVTLVSELLLNF
jgi:tRNA1Val (adenine37-N6)-methyltransferase